MDSRTQNLILQPLPSTKQKIDRLIFLCQVLQSAGEGESVDVGQAANEKHQVEEEIHSEPQSHEISSSASEEGVEGEESDGGAGGDSLAPEPVVEGSTKGTEGHDRSESTGEASYKLDEILSVTSDKVGEGAEMVETAAETLSEKAGGAVDHMSEGAETAVEKLESIIQVGISDTKGAVQGFLGMADKELEVANEAKEDDTSCGDVSMKASVDGVAIGVGEALNTEVESVGAAATTMADRASSAVEEGQEGLVKGVASTVDAMKAGGETVAEGIENVSDALEAGRENVAGGRQKLKEASEEGLEAAAETAREGVTSGARVLRNTAQEEAGAMKELVEKGLPEATETLVKTAEAGAESVKEAVNSAGQGAEGLYSSGAETLSEVAMAAGAVVSGGVAAVQGAVDEVKKVVSDYVGGEKSEGKSNVEVEEASDVEAREEGEEEEESCPFCKFMKAGPCGKQFSSWEKCVDEAEAAERDIVSDCKTHTQAMTICMEANTDYYSPVLETGREMAAEGVEVVEADIKNAEIVEAGSVGDVVAD